MARVTPIRGGGKSNKALGKGRAVRATPTRAGGKANKAIGKKRY